ncbi:MAG TPA: transaldolase [Actinomycetes bacterium]|jgi:transaldolase|nr:transaldolase [Actinomycetes bacterium]
MTSRLQQLTDQGVAVWVDSIARDWIQKGELRRLRDQFQVVGVTSNPTIFQKAMGEGSFYDEDITRLAGQGLDAQAIFESLALDDIRAAAADMEPVWERTGGVDGRISFEVAPDIADDTQATISEARRLFDELARPNVFIKIPATAAGVPAIRASIATGINVNVTLIFSIQRYREVIEAYLGGLEELAEAGGDLTEVASVASFFVSRVDTLVDKELQAIVDKGGDQADAARDRLGTAAIDNAKLAYEVFEQTFQGARWAELERQGARVQRPLWASTSTKNPDYRDVLYVEELVARDTVNTMPLETIEAFADHGEVRGQTAREDLDRAHRLWSDLAELGIDEGEVGWRLEREGVEKFADSYNGAVETIEAKRTRLGGSTEGRE